MPKFIFINIRAQQAKRCSSGGCSEMLKYNQIFLVELIQLNFQISVGLDWHMLFFKSHLTGRQMRTKYENQVEEVKSWGH